MLLPPKTLLLAVGFPRCDPADFIDIAQRIAKIAPEIDVRIFHPYRFDELPREIWKKPTLLINLMLSENLNMPRGASLLSQPLGKTQQAEMFRVGGIRSPKTAIYEFGMPLNPGDWGDYVLLKPLLLRMNSHGQGIHVFRTLRLAGVKADSFPDTHFLRATPMLIQQFVDTGSFPQKYRALTLCGEVLYIAEDTSDLQRPSLAAADDELESGSFHANGGRIEYGLHPEIHEFGRKIAKAFPLVPLLGCDIVRDARSNELYALEVNAGGNVWHFSSQFMAEGRARKPDVVKTMQGQYGAFDVAAKALVKATRWLAA